MAKRFTDTDKWKDDWFIQLPVKMKAVWDYLCENCDSAGVWKANFHSMRLLLGEEVTREEITTHLGPKVLWLSESRLWVKGFIAFQYGALKPTNATHRGIMKRIYQLGADLPLSDEIKELIRRFELSPTYKPNPGEGSTTPADSGAGSTTLKEEEEDKEEEKKNLNPKTSGASKIPPSSASSKGHGVTPDDVDLCRKEWVASLRALGQPRDFVLPGEEQAIARAIVENGPAVVRLALYGARHEPGNDRFDPRAHVDITRVLTKDREGKPRIQKFVGYGVKARERENSVRNTRELVEQSRVAMESDESDIPEADPAKVRALMKNLFPGMAS